MPGDGRLPFGAGAYQRDLGFGFWTQDGFFAAADMIGPLVNIGSKDGVVFERTRITGVDARGYLTLEGGRMGWPWQEREPEELHEPEQLWIYDIARGFIWREP